MAVNNDHNFLLKYGIVIVIINSIKGVYNEY